MNSRPISHEMDPVVVIQVTTAHVLVLALIWLAHQWIPQREEARFIEWASVSGLVVDGGGVSAPVSHQTESPTSAIPNVSLTTSISAAAKPSPAVIQTVSVTSTPKGHVQVSSPANPRPSAVQQQAAPKPEPLPKAERERVKSSPPSKPEVTTESPPRFSLEDRIRQVQVNKQMVRREAASPSGPASTAATSEGFAGLAEEDVRHRLQGALGQQSGTSEGTQGGTAGGAEDHSWYDALIERTIKQHWNRPPGGDPDGQPVVRIRIKPDGLIQFVSLSSSSGDATLDAAARLAVERAGRVPQPLPAGVGNPDYWLMVRFDR